MSAAIFALNRATTRSRFARWIKALHRHADKIHMAEEFARLDRHTLHDVGLSHIFPMGL